MPLNLVVCLPAAPPRSVCGIGNQLLHLAEFYRLTEAPQCNHCCQQLSGAFVVPAWPASTSPSILGNFVCRAERKAVSFEAKNMYLTSSCTKKARHMAPQTSLSRTPAGPEDFIGEEQARLQSKLVPERLWESQISPVATRYVQLVQPSALPRSCLHHNVQLFDPLACEKVHTSDLEGQSWLSSLQYLICQSSGNSFLKVCQPCQVAHNSCLLITLPPGLKYELFAPPCVQTVQ